MHGLNHARGLRYRGPWRLPGPDSHRLAALSLSIGYVITTSTPTLPWRPIFWTHPPFAGLETLLSPSGTGFAGTLPGAG